VARSTISAGIVGKEAARRASELTKINAGRQALGYVLL
jgi:hypothetical protein